VKRPAILAIVKGDALIDSTDEHAPELLRYALRAPASDLRAVRTKVVLRQAGVRG
jgi:hypothetical protein